METHLLILLSFLQIIYRLSTDYLQITYRLFSDYFQIMSDYLQVIFRLSSGIQSYLQEQESDSSLKL